jgi:hypothetical protein
LFFKKGPFSVKKKSKKQFSAFGKIIWGQLAVFPFIPIYFFHSALDEFTLTEEALQQNLIDQFDLTGSSYDISIRNVIATNTPSTSPIMKSTNPTLSPFIMPSTTPSTTAPSSGNNCFFFYLFFFFYCLFFFFQKM